MGFYQLFVNNQFMVTNIIVLATTNYSDDVVADAAAGTASAFSSAASNRNPITAITKSDASRIKPLRVQTISGSNNNRIQKYQKPGEVVSIQ